MLNYHNPKRDFFSALKGKEGRGDFRKDSFNSFPNLRNQLPSMGNNPNMTIGMFPQKRFYDRSEQNRFSCSRWHLCHHGPMKAQCLLNPFLHILLVIKEFNILHIKAYNEYSVPAIFQAVTPISMLKSNMVSFLKKKKSQKDRQSFIKSPANLKVYN